MRVQQEDEGWNVGLADAAVVSKADVESRQGEKSGNVVAILIGVLLS